VKVSLAQAMRDPNLLGAPFQAPSFWPWHAVAKLISGEQLETREAELFHECTGRSKLPTRPVKRLIVLGGRRTGKDRFESPVAVHRAALSGNWKSVMSAGEQASVILIGADKKQARILRRYCQGLLQTPLLAAEVTRTSDEMIEFRSGATLEVVTNDASLVRGRSAIAVLGSECCWWNTAEGSSSSDEDVVGAAEPSLAMCPDGGLLMLASSVGRRAGFMYRKWKELFGVDDAEDLVWLAPSRTMNPALPQKVVDKAYADDPQRAKAEFGSEWRDDLAAFLDPALVDAAVDRGIVTRSPQKQVKYFGFVDVSGGVADAYALAIAHKDGDKIILDNLTSRKAPFNPATVTGDMAKVGKEYGIGQVTGDRYSAQWAVQSWAAQGIKYVHSDRDRSEIYIEALPLFSAGRARILDNPKLILQLCALERRQTPTRDRVDHARGAGHHDDEANACAGAMTLASRGSGVVIGKSSIIVCTAPRPDIFASSAGSSRSWDRLIRSGAG
jgi:hypothetical protein